MNTYYIFHPVGGVCNTACIPGEYEYELVASMSAESMESAFMAAQNENPDYESFEVRSTSVGDIIQSEEDLKNNRCHLVKPIGFQEVRSNWLHFIDWGNHMSFEDLKNESDLNAFESQSFEG